MTKQKLESNVNKLKKMFPDINGIEVEYGICIHLGDAAEGGTIDEIPAADYYAEDYKEIIYVMGVNKKLNEGLEKLGMYAEWENAGVLKAFPE